MTLTDLSTVLLIIKENFGPLIAEVCEKLNSTCGLTIKELIHSFKERYSGIQIKKSIITLLQHRLVINLSQDEELPKYSLDAAFVLTRIYQPLFIDSFQNNFGVVGVALLKLLFHYGSIPLKNLIDEITSLFIETKTSTEILEQVVKLIELHAIGRHTQEACTKSASISMCPPINPSIIDNMKSTYNNKRSCFHNDDNIYVCPNIPILCELIVKEFISNFIKRNFDECSAHIVRHVFEICRINSSINSELRPAALFETLLSSVSTLPSLNRNSLMAYISILSDSQDPYLLSDGNSVNPGYSIDVPKLLRKICEENICWFIGERYGKYAKRIFRLLLDKTYLEQKHISDFSMVPFKETKEILYQMYLDSIIDCKQIIRTPDANPLSSIYLFTANFDHSVSIILEYAKTFAGKIIDRRISLNDKIKTLLQKNIKICSEFDMDSVPITSIMRCILSNDKQIQYLSESEKCELSSFHGSISQLDFSEINIAQVILVLDTFIKVST